MKNFIPIAMIVIFIVSCFYAAFVFPKDIEEARYMNLTFACEDCQSQPKDWYMIQPNEDVSKNDFVLEEVNDER